MDLCHQSDASVFNTLSGFVIAFLSGSRHLLISWLQSLSTMILEPMKIKSVTVPIVFPSICHEIMGPDTMILVSLSVVLSFKPAFHSLSPSSRGSLVPLHFLPYRVVICISEIDDISPDNLDSSLWFIQPSISRNIFCL